MREELENIRTEAMTKIKKSINSDNLEEIRVKYLGKKGVLTGILRGMGSLSPEERPAAGKLANDVREEIENAIENAKKSIKEKEREQRLAFETIDVTMPGKANPIGGVHPLTKVLDEIQEIFLGMGFSVAEGPEVELDYYNFEALNIPKNHPARDEQDTFYIKDGVVLRTQTSPVQIREMEKSKPPIRIIAPGRVYRSDAVDATHSPMFTQIEGLVVDEGITMSDLKGTLDTFAKRFFGESTKTKFRPHHFPFTEPSAEVDVSCFACGGKGCRICKNSGWIEILGCGMVHPDVLRRGKIDPEKYSGFAFGMGLERLAMIKYGIDDIRLFYENDLRFLKQF
ncbi:MAG TPA: phenylalanine--tRNA ligase subunit alpha [Clostridiaceae bacterium]|jgi:phenylalanyl-tRNA synthetase alpha chain|nr:phenylalanine--tRNA ligase subunit alpha [Clostridiaceae bacterium]HBG39590.1 phenylalanine--tRNA ligase subunit alpha [Clostridiaceae bacterium]HBN28809.1 phenylalanine--tRNA ligase subunit alpha [Clostridiaceae bacterium]HBX47596.1 phenylalanine--tRNA ligase subunit alpha [Clostridiaceae bacterium]HCL49874.1 phenylalanine--tRNA ligase subunit alpha [Clostridiaceae bacterium]